MASLADQVGVGIEEGGLGGNPIVCGVRECGGFSEGCFDRFAGGTPGDGSDVYKVARVEGLEKSLAGGFHVGGNMVDHGGWRVAALERADGGGNEVMGFAKA